MRSSDWIILATICGGSIFLYFMSNVAQTLLSPAPGEDMFWLSALLINLLGYATVFLPGYYVIKYVKKTNYLDIGPSSLISPLVRLCVKGNEFDNLDEDTATTKPTSDDTSRSVSEQAVQGVICTVGLIGTYGAWGYLQEKIMTTNYEDSLGNKAMYKNSQFLVFVNRILAFFIAVVIISFRRQPRHRAPLFKYSFCSFSNIMSSWCQYEALKFVSFPTQVLSKASKVIPVMIMGKIVSNKKYEFYEYVVAVLISLGMVAFLFGNSGDNQTDRSTTFAGFIILIGYMSFDSFTSNWQGALLTEYKMTSYQMMAGVNLFSCLLTSVSLIQQGVFLTSLEFMSQYNSFLVDCVILSICSAGGQLFIYHTINTFGPVNFTIIMTCRQVVSVILSCIVFKHSLSLVSVIGVCIVFGAVFLKIYAGIKLKAKKKTAAAAGNVNKI